jgi:hypothetical protein
VASVSPTQLSLEEKHRGLKRKEFLAQVTQAGKMSGLNFVSAAKEAVSILHQVTTVLSARDFQYRDIVSVSCKICVLCMMYSVS